MPRIFPTIYPGLILPEVADALNEALAELGALAYNIRATEPLYSVQDGGGVVIGLDLQSDMAMMAIPPGSTVNNGGTINNYGEVNNYGITNIFNPVFSQCIPVTWFETDVKCESGILNVYRRNIVIYMVNGCPQISTGVWYFYAHVGTCTGTTGTPVVPTVPTCQYVVTVYLNWESDASDNNTDFDLYVGDITAGDVCWYGNLTSTALNLASGDCFPGCAAAPIPPEVTLGTFSAGNSFKVWYNQHGTCSPLPQFDPEQYITVTNTGTGNITFTMDGVSTVVTPGQTLFWSTNYAYAGYDTGDQHAYASGTPFSVACGGTPPGPPSGITTGCCTGAIPFLLHCTLTSVGGGCACLNGTYALVYDGISAWRYSGLVCGGTTLNLVLTCTGPGNIWTLVVSDGPFNQPSNVCDPSSTCSPFVENFTSFPYAMVNACTGHVTAVVTV